MIQIELNGKFVEVSKHQLYELARRGQIGPETRVVADGTETLARKIKGIEFGTKIAPVSSATIKEENNSANQDRLPLYKQQYYGQTKPFAETMENRVEVPPNENNVANNELYTGNLESEFPSLAKLVSTLLTCNAIWAFMCAAMVALGAIGTMISLKNSDIPGAPPILILSVVVAMIGIFFVYYVWKTIFMAIDDINHLAYSLYVNSIAQTAILEKLLEKDDI
ncbi:MAG: hypothetical protein FWC43_10280 [Planctomycetaceae bacterium]|nr:hypothetical protein [Planctomycetaceae bacterium]